MEWNANVSSGLYFYRIETTDINKELVNGEQAAGWHREVWNANVSTGMYYYRIEAISTNDPNNRFVQVKKMLLLR